ncbi:hypothetical protein ceV_064 [Chrysochromulina ericina virus CeV-01B]|uniref:Uncharacterized protein n=1 Tax=Chrysochromulina ericina virus CeV-01B TaxID=3070830 RepID=A0A0N9QWU3_9VIRU|nr:hypothetical protein ceV_064 [Chrysochromulina ericina virus]ALH22970.1 hypothetical protein ceV_064 [Chrysochromulina ericina virus CeV-01B]
MDRSNLVKRSLKLRKLKYDNKTYALDKDTYELYDYNLVMKGTLKNVGKLNLEKDKKSIDFYNKDSMDSIKKSVRRNLDAINKKKFSEFNEKEYQPGGPGYMRALERFRSNQQSISKRSYGGKKGQKKT